VKKQLNSNEGIDIPMLLLAIHSGRKSEVNNLIAAGLDVNSVDSEGMTPLMAAAMSGNLAITQLLLEAGARTEMANKWGMTACEIAIWHGFNPLAELLGRHETYNEKTSDEENGINI